MKDCQANAVAERSGLQGAWANRQKKDIQPGSKKRGMGRYADKTTTVRGGVAFRTTPWTDILDARSDDESGRQAAIEELLGMYWKPVYCYLPCKGHDHEAAKDLTQGFFHEVVLSRGLIQRADRTGGRFRTFLLKALWDYAASVRRAEKAKRRMPEGGLLRLDSMDELPPRSVPVRQAHGGF